MSVSDRTAILRTGAFLLGVALLSFLVAPHPAKPPTKNEIRQTIAQHLEKVAHARTDRAETMQMLANYLAQNQPAARSAVASLQIDHIASLILDRDPAVARRALDILSRLGAPARPAAARVVAYLRSEPSRQFDRFAWDVEFALRSDAPSVAEFFALIRAMDRSTIEQQGELIRRIAMLADYLVVHGDRVNPKVFLDPAVDAIAGVLSRNEAPEPLLIRAARALGSLGPRARSAVPAIEAAIAEARAQERKNAVCTGPCGFPVVEEYARALKCIRMDQEQFEIDYRFGRSCAFSVDPRF